MALGRKCMACGRVVKHEDPILFHKQRNKHLLDIIVFHLDCVQNEITSFEMTDVETVGNDTAFYELRESILQTGEVFPDGI